MNRATFANLILQVMPMPRFYEPDLTTDPNSPFVRDAADRLVRRSYWMDMTDPTLLMAMNSWNWRKSYKRRETSASYRLAPKPAD